MSEFKIGRALGLSFRAWGRNLVPFTVLALVLYAAPVVWILTTDLSKATSVDDLANRAFVYPIYALTLGATMISPLLTYRVVQDLNGQRVAMSTSLKYGLRGILPAIILAVVVNVLGLIPMGGIIASVITCIWFVAVLAAVAERLGPIPALVCSVALTSGCRWGIFGLNFLIGLVAVILMVAWLVPMISEGSGDLEGSMRTGGLVLIGVLGLFQLFSGIVAAVSYALLRQDKDGISHEELARVFE